MRQRKLKDLDQRVEEHQELFIQDPERWRGHWLDLEDPQGSKEKVFLEIGCGKGAFITTHAKENPQNRYIAIEGQMNVLIRVAEKIQENRLDNVVLIGQYIHSLDEIFQEGEIDGLYLNFSDPWPKKRHSKRRLTHRDYLASYEKAVKKGGFIAIKTDSQALFEFSVEEAKARGLEIKSQSRDLHNSDYEAKQVMTEYEKKFSQRGLPIFYLELKIN